MTAPTTRWRSVVPRPRWVGPPSRAAGRHRSLPALLVDGAAALPNSGAAGLPNGADEPAPQRARADERVPSMDGVGLGGVPGARVAGRYRLTRPVPAHGVQHPSPPPLEPSPGAAPDPGPEKAVGSALDGTLDDRVGRTVHDAPRPAARSAARRPVPGQLWLAQDEILGRPVLVRLLPADDPAAQSLLTAARRAARLVDQGALAVLDAAVGPLTPPGPGGASCDRPAEGAAGGRPATDELPQVVYVIGEWVEAVDLATLLAQGPLPAREAARIAAEVARVLGHAHGEGLAHRQVVPEDVLLTESGRVALAGLGVEAALHGQDESATEEARRADLRAAGAVLYAGLTARWPLGAPHAGTSLPAAPREGLLPCSPRQVRAAVPADLDELACRALGAARRGQLPVTSADELADLLDRAGSGRAAGSRAGTGWAGTTRLGGERGEAGWDDPWDDGWADQSGSAEPDDRPTGTWPVAPEGRRTVGAAAAVVGTVLAAGVALLAWQVLAPADAGPTVLAPNPGAVAADGSGAVGAGEGPIRVVGARAFDPQGDGHEDDASAALALDGDRGTAWTTQTYYGSAHLGGLKDGVGLVVDLGAVREVRTVGLDLLGRGTDLQVRAAVVPAGARPGSSGPAAPPARIDGFPVLLGAATDTGSSVAVRAPQPVTARYLLVWLTALPPVSPAGSGPPGAASAAAGPGGGAGTAGRTVAFRGGVAEVRVSGPDPTAR